MPSTVRSVAAIFATRWLAPEARRRKGGGVARARRRRRRRRARPGRGTKVVPRQLGPDRVWHDIRAIRPTRRSLVSKVSWGVSSIPARRHNSCAPAGPTVRSIAPALRHNSCARAGPTVRRSRLSIAPTRRHNFRARAGPNVLVDRARASAQLLCPRGTEHAVDHAGDRAGHRACRSRPRVGTTLVPARCRSRGNRAGAAAQLPCHA